jgi:uncharacterized protein (DUF58 family)
MMQPLTLSSLLQIPAFEVRAKILAEGILTGTHRAKRQGGGAEFVEHRLYTPGDPIRDIDWKVLGRFDRYYIRKREEEKTLLVWLLIDASNSMNFGEAGTHKLSYSVHLAAALAYFFMQGRHEVGLLFLQGSSSEVMIPARGGQSHLARLFSALQSATPSGVVDFAQDMARIAEQKRRALVFAFSDLLSFSEDGETPLALMPLRLLAARGHDVSLVQIAAPEEMNLPYSEYCEFEDLETNEKILLDAGGLQDAYREEMQSFLQQAKNACIESKIEHQTAITSEPLNKILVELFQERAL